MIGLDAKFNKVRNAIDDGPCFSRSGAGDHQMRAIDGCDGVILGLIQLLLVVDSEFTRVNEVERIGCGGFECKFFHERVVRFATRYFKIGESETQMLLSLLQ